MGFLDERPIAKIVSGSILIISAVTFLTGQVPEQSTEIATVLIGASAGFLFGNSVPTAQKA